MIGQMAFAIALPGFNNLGRSVTPTFPSRNKFHFTIISTLSKNEQKNQCEKLKKKSRFLATT